MHVVAVPAEYAAPHGAQGRARAMQYAVQHSSAGAGDWVVYLGAASVLRERTVRAPRARRRAAASAPERCAAQVDAILAHVVDEAYRLKTPRQAADRHASQYGRIAQVRRCAPARRRARGALMRAGACRGPRASARRAAAGRRT